MKIEDIAKICHDANKALCQTQGDLSQMEFAAAPPAVQQSAVDGVIFALANPKATPKLMHEAWREAKLADGWQFGAEKDLLLKTHPCLVDYDQLPAEQQAKDHLFLNIVKALKKFVDKQ